MAIKAALWAVAALADFALAGNSHTAHTEAVQAHQEPSKKEQAAVPDSKAKGTEVCGVLKLAEEWTEAGSPYRITGDVFVPVTSRLRIEAGVEIRFASRPKPCPDAGEAHAVEKPGDRHGHDSKSGHDTAKTPSQDRNPNTPPKAKDFSDSAYTTLTVEGAFYCIGTPEKPVRFLPADTSPEAAPWDGLRLMGQRQGRAEIAFAEFRGASVGLYAERADFRVHHSLFADNTTGLWSDLRGDVTVLNCVFARNRSAGIFVRGGTPHIVNSIFWENRNYGLWSDGRKTLVVEYNAFFGNGEEDCYRCPHTLLPLGETGKPDSVDGFGNRRADPFFEGSPSFKAARAADPRYDTPTHLIKDTALASAEKRTRWKWWGKKQAAAAFTLRGRGPWALSEYSSLREMGHPSRNLRNTDGSRGDMGLWGGPMERITKDPFLGF